MVKTIKSSYAHNNYIILVHLVAMREREENPIMLEQKNTM